MRNKKNKINKINDEMDRAITDLQEKLDQFEDLKLKYYEDKPHKLYEKRIIDDKEAPIPYLPDREYDMRQI